jgi:predicted ATP-grasp superfamily ATP-dependent carboligase
VKEAKNNTNPRVLVTYAWVRSSWAIIRNLARHGLEVHAGDYQSVFMSRFSRYTKGWFTYPNYHDDPEGFIDSVVHYIKEHDIGTYIPSHEEGFVVSRYLDRFPENVKIPISSPDVIDLLNHKGQCEKLASELGIPTPQTFSVSGPDEFEREVGNFPAKGVIKIPYSHGSHGVSFYTGLKELKEKWHAAYDSLDDKENIPIVQKFIEGAIYTATALVDNGNVLANFARKNIREKESFGGAAVKCESINFPEGKKYANKMLSYIKYTGVAMFEFLVDENSGETWLMEVNPRYWGTSAHDFDSGVHYPYLHYCLANNLDAEFFPEYDLGYKTRWIAGDVISYFKHRQNKETKRSVFDYLDVNDNSFMDFKLDDPIPFFVQSYLYFKHRKAIFKTK